MLILSTEDLRQAVPMAQAMEAVASAFAQYSAGQVTMPLRQSITLPHDGLALLMPAHLAGSDAFGIKALTLFTQNPTKHNLPAIHALVLLFDTATGAPLALMSGGSLTALRTGAASGVATQTMARSDADTLALFGAGAQALPQAWAVCVARPIRRILLVNRTREHAERLAEELRAFGDPIPGDVGVATGPAEALAEAGVVCCATSALAPLFVDGDLRPGAHINAIGAYLPTIREVPGATVARARVVVDSRASAWAEAGDLILARDEGLIGEAHITGELGEVVLGRIPGRIPGRMNEGQITLFKSVGIAAQDVAVAQLAYNRARELGLGLEAQV